jgi:predicted aspartyl protease
MAVSQCVCLAALSPQEILSSFKAATGGSTWDSVKTVVTTSDVEQGGLKGVDTSWQDVTTGLYADHSVVAGVSESDGYDGTRSWMVDSAGLARYLDSEGDKRSALTNAYLVSMAFWYPARRSGIIAPDTVGANLGTTACDVVTIRPTEGDSIDLWIDLSTHLLLQTVEQTTLLTVTTRFSDFRTVDGITLPYESRVSTGNSKYDMTIKATSVQVNVPIASSIFTPKATAVPDYTIGKQEKSVTVPFRYELGHIFVSVKVNGNGPFDAFLDTGGRLAMTPQFAKQNKVDSTGQLPGSGTGPSTVSQAIAKVSTLEIGDITINNLIAGVIPMPTPANTLLIGDEIFKRFAVRVDFDTLTLTFTPLNNFTYSGSGITVPFHFAGEIPEAAGTIDGVSGDFMIDTGSGNSVELFPAFIKQHNLADRYKPAFNVTSGYGIGGAQTAGVARAEKFSLGTASAQKTLVYLSNAQSGSFADTQIAGNVGGGFLHRFNLIFDYGRQEIIFEPNSHTSEPDAYERLGVVVESSDHGCVVTDVVPNSPADQAGIKSGDVITELNFNKLRINDGLWFESQTLQPAGTVLQLRVKHGKETKDLSVTLRDLV